MDLQLQILGGMASLTWTNLMPWLSSIEETWSSPAIRRGKGELSLKLGVLSVLNEWITLQGRGTKVGDKNKMGKMGVMDRRRLSVPRVHRHWSGWCRQAISPCHWATTTSAKNGSTYCRTLAFAFAAVLVFRRSLCRTVDFRHTRPVPFGSYLSMSRLCSFQTQVSDLRCHSGMTA